MRGYETRTKIDVITTLVTRGMAALLQSAVEWVEWSSDVKVYYLASPEEVLDEGEGLEVLASLDGIEDPLVVSINIDHGLKCEELSEDFKSEMCSLGQFAESEISSRGLFFVAGRRSLGRMRWRGGSFSVSASSIHARILDLRL